MKKKNNYLVKMALIYLVVFAAYNLLVFTIFSNYNEIFWISYGFMILSFIIHIGCIFNIFKNISVEAVFFGIPLGSFSIYFVLAELFTSVVFMIFKEHASVKVTIVIQALLLFAFLIIAIASIMTRDAVQDIDEKITENVSFIKGLNADLEIMMKKSNNQEIKDTLKNLSETVKYSDPISNSAVKSQEQMIVKSMNELKSVFDSGDIEKIKNISSQIDLLFFERNKILITKK